MRGRAERIPESLSEIEGGIIKDEPGAEFLPAGRFGGSKAGYDFKEGAQGLGYYRDYSAPSNASGDWQAHCD